MSTEQEVEELAAINAVTDRIISCAIEVNRQLGPGLLEQTYETMCVELTEAGDAFERQAAFSVIYKDSQIGEHQADQIVERADVVELKVSNVTIRCSWRRFLLIYRTASGLLINSTVAFCEPGFAGLFVSRKHHSAPCSVFCACGYVKTAGLGALGFASAWPRHLLGWVPRRARIARRDRRC
jgi:GxxExxY protein